MDIANRNAELSSELCGAFPPEMVGSVFNSRMCDIDPEFMGFVAIYEGLSRIIPEHFTVVDLGCAFAPQAYFFRNHAGYVGVDIADGPRFSTTNTTHYTMSMDDFCRSDLHQKYGEAVFVICSYVPSDRSLVRATFDKLFTYYPCSNK